MKARRELSRPELALEVVSQLRSRFVPSSEDINRCMNLLLDKEFLEILRDGQIGYLA
jgi:cullin 1